MGLVDQILPMMGMGAMDATQGPAQIPQMGTAQQQGSMMPYMDPAAMAQLQTDTLDYQRRNQLANQLMSTGYVPNSGKFGMLAGIASMLGGKFAQSQNDQKLSDIVKRQIDLQQQAAQAEHAQQQADLKFKTDEEIRHDTGKAAADQKYAKSTYVPGVGFVDGMGNLTVNPDIAKTLTATQAAEANATARANAAYREAPGAAGDAAAARIQKIMAMPDGALKQALLTKELGEGGMQALTFNSMFSGGGSGGGGGGQASNAGGGAAAPANGADPDALARLNPAMRGQVQAIGEYRQAPLTSMAMRSPMGAALMQAVNQVYPNYDATTYPTRSKARVDFTSGAGGKTINSANTAIEHAGQLLDAGDALGNYSGLLTPLNGPKNATAAFFGAPAPKEFAQNREALAGELTKAFRGASGSEKDIAEMRDNISAAGSPEQLHAAVGKAMQLLASKVGELKGQYDNAMGPGAPNFYSPGAQAALKKLNKAGVDTGDLGSDIGATQGAPTAQPAPTATATGPNGQKIGLVNGQWVPL